MFREYFYDMIFKRKSFHTFRNIEEEKITEEEINGIYSAYNTFLPLHPHIKTEIKVIPADKTTCKRGQEYCVLLYSEEKDGFLQNIGYIGQQLDLYLVSKNIGTLWFGIGKTEEKSESNLPYVIMLAIKKVSDDKKFRKDMFKSKRKSTQEIWQGEHIDDVTDIIKFAPSACNTQPWIVEREGNILRVYRYKKEGKRGIMPADKVSYYNRIDIGIFMCFLDICLTHEGISFKRTLYTDCGGSDEKVLNAEYIINC